MKTNNRSREELVVLAQERRGRRVSPQRYTGPGVGNKTKQISTGTVRIALAAPCAEGFAVKMFYLFGSVSFRDQMRLNGTSFSGKGPPLLSPYFLVDSLGVITYHAWLHHLNRGRIYVCCQRHERECCLRIRSAVRLSCP